MSKKIENKDELNDYREKYDVLCNQYQETWNKSWWNIYDEIKKENDSPSFQPQIELSKSRDLSIRGDLKNTLTDKSGTDIMNEVDFLAEIHQHSMINSKNYSHDDQKKCCACVLF